jgi:beta-lactamase regulating signal transducer with metallopeptidase domain/HEAT repeat protein
MFIITVILKATAIFVATWAVASLLRHRSPAIRHLVWSAGLVAVLAVPLLTVSLPWQVAVSTPLPAEFVAPFERTPTPVSTPVLEEAAPTDIVTLADEGATGASLPPLGSILLWVWISGALIAASRLARGIVSVSQTIKHGAPLTDHAWTRPLMESADRLEVETLPLLVSSERAPMPFTGGVWRPFIVVPASAEAWDDRRRRAVLSHELAHIRRHDVIVNTIAQLVCAVWWFHPLAWMAARQLRKESERACDNLVLGTGTRASEYADHLLQIVCSAAHGRSPALALPMAERREFEGRMLAILDTVAERHPPNRRHAAALALGAALVVLPLAIVVPTSAAPTDVPPTAPAIQAALPELTPEPVANPASQPAPVQPATRPAPQQAAVPQDTSRLVNALLRALSDSIADIRENAAYALGSRRVAAAAEPLARALTTDSDADVREMAAWSIAQIRSLRGVMGLARAVTSDASAGVREMAAWAIASLGQPAAEDGGPALVAALGDSDAEVRAIAAWAIGSMRIRVQSDALINALRDPTPDVAQAAAWAIGQARDPRAVPALATAMNTSNEDVQEAVMWALGQMQGEEAQDALVTATASDNPAVRRAAVAALAGSRGNPWPWPRPRPIVR